MIARIWNNDTESQQAVDCKDQEQVAAAHLELLDRIAAALERIIAHMPA